jgi:hypothetical protein
MYYRTVRDYFAYQGPPPRCDCDLLQTEYCCQHEDLVHTVLVEQPLLDERTSDGTPIDYRIEIRRCPVCELWWWMHLRNEVHHTYERDTETVIGSVGVTFSSAVRCPTLPNAYQLNAWFPRFLAAYQHCQRLHRERSPALFDAARICAELAARDARTALLADTFHLPRASDVTLAEHRPRLAECIAALEKRPDDLTIADELLSLQRLCWRDRLRDAAVKPEHWTIEEVWSPALAGVSRWEYEITALRHAARGKAIGSPEHRALRRMEDAIATAWQRHGQREWPHPTIEFHFLLEHAKTLQPDVVAGDKASWEHPRQVCMRLYRLLKDHGVVPSWRVQVPAWIAERTGLPDGAKRTHDDACRRALLSKRRSQRAY